MKRYSHLLAGASWMEEYGDPDKPEEWEYLKTFSPYQNVQGRGDVPARALHDHHPRRPGPPGPRPEDVGQDAGPGLRRALLREHRGWPRRRAPTTGRRRTSPPSRTSSSGSKGKTILYSMLVFVPASFWLGLTHASPVAVFVVSCLAILPLAGLMGEATEHLAHHTGPGMGGLLNATFGNAAELIIALHRPAGGRDGDREGLAHRLDHRQHADGARPGDAPRGLEAQGAALQPHGRGDRQRHDAAGGRGARDPRDLRDGHPPPQPEHIESISLDISCAS